MEKEIKKIAILHCKKSGRVCTGAACFRAFYDRKKSFEQYEGQPVELSAYFDCNGCEAAVSYTHLTLPTILLV